MFTQNSSNIFKSRYWMGVLYPDNMMEDWEVEISDVLQVPFAYALHDQDLDKKGEDRKVHLHVILAFANTTTKTHALNVFNLLSVPGSICCSTAEACISIRKSYDYLIHDTETCRRKGKFQYPASARITGNNFDIGAYEQLSSQQRAELCKELCDVIVEMNFTNFVDFYIYVTSQFEDMNYFMMIQTYSGLFERLTKSNFLKLNFSAYVPSQGPDPRRPTEENQFFCPDCGSIHVKKKGKTGSGSQRMLCKDCGKSFTT